MRCMLFLLQRFFSTQRQCWLTFLWIDLQMLLSCCLIHTTIIIPRHKCCLVVPWGLGVPSKNKNFKNDFFSWSEFCYWTKVKAKYVFLIKIMLLNEKQTFFVCLCFFGLTFLKSNSLTFRFSLTWRDTKYQTIKFFSLYL